MKNLAEIAINGTIGDICKLILTLIETKAMYRTVSEILALVYY